MRIIIKIIGIFSFLFFSGLLAASLLIMLYMAGEKFKFWSEKYFSYKKWARWILYLIIFLLAALPLSYGFLFWIRTIAWFIRGDMYPLFVMLIGILIVFVIFLIPNKQNIFRENSKNKFAQGIPYTNIVVLRLSNLCFLPLFTSIAAFWVISEINPFGVHGEGWMGGIFIYFGISMVIYIVSAVYSSIIISRKM